MRLLHRLVLAVLLVPLLVRAARAEQPLRLEGVLASVERHFPLIEAARRDQQAAEAELLSARGAFDPTVRTRLDGAPLGGYRNGRFDLLLDVPTPLWGTSLFTGYRVSFGKFADYDGKLETNQYGELRAGFAIPLLRNGATDRRRAGIARAELGVPVASTGIKQALLEAERAGSFRYWEWVAAGQRLRVAKLLLKLAEERDVATADRVRRGELARIERIDNQRAVLGRRGAVVTAERALQAAAIELSIYLRDERGEPILPDASRLPEQLPGPQPPAPEPGSGAAARGADEASVALRNRPELERLRLVRAQLRIERDLARNQLLPAIDLLALVSQDFGPGSALRAPTVIEGGVSIDLPTLNRTARGRLRAAEAALARLDAQERFTRDRIRAELTDVLSAIAAARERVRVAREEVLLSREVEEAERTRFALGDSNLIFVNLREQATVEASLREIDALLDYHRALAAYRAVLAAG
jgi:cobalt-zinc-cadmium efflux system outer membrane protein